MLCRVTLRTVYEPIKPTRPGCTAQTIMYFEAAEARILFDGENAHLAQIFLPGDDQAITYGEEDGTIEVVVYETKGSVHYPFRQPDET